MCHVPLESSDWLKPAAASTPDSGVFLVSEKNNQLPVIFICYIVYSAICHLPFAAIAIPAFSMVLVV
jgi:hypothetical protein